MKQELARRQNIYGDQTDFSEMANAWKKRMRGEER